jgi:putative membrane protein
MVDLSLAILHHVLIFALAAVIASEATLVRPGMSGPEVRRVASIDRAYGALASLIIVVGVCRVVFGAKGWDYYVVNPWFWAKMITFGMVGLLSIRPTLAFLGWRKAQTSNPAALPPPAELAGVRRLVLAQAGLFLLIPAFAAAMARY